MSAARMLFLSAILGLGACSSPTAPSVTAATSSAPVASTPGGHSQPLDSGCSATGPKVLCSPRY